VILYKPKLTWQSPEIQARLERERILQMRTEAVERAKEYTQANKGQGKYKYIVVSGNNSNIIRKCMQLRSERWEETNSFDKLYNFKWQPISWGINFDANNSFGTRQLVNHFANHNILTTKDKLFENVVAHCEAQKINAFSSLPVTFVLSLDSHFFANEIEKFCSYFMTIEKSLHAARQELNDPS